MYNKYQQQTMPSVTATEANIFPILATIGVPIEIMGMITCEMAGFCHIFDDDDDDQSDEVEYDQSDDEEQPGESNTLAAVRWKRNYLRVATPCRHAVGTIQSTGIPGELVFFSTGQPCASAPGRSFLTNVFFPFPSLVRSRIRCAKNYKYQLAPTSFPSNAPL